MIKIFKEEKLQVLTFIFLIFIISFLAFWRAFSFDFWGEDWEQIWFTIFSPSMINYQYEVWPHPIVIYEELFLAKFLGSNPFYWQIVGYLLKVLGAFAVSLMILGIARSKKAAFFTGLTFASSVGGLASVTWVAAHTSALIIPFLCVGIYFWIIKKKYVLALALLLFSVWSSPARGILGSFIVILWDILSFIQNRTENSSKRAWKRILILIIAIFFLKSFLAKGLSWMSPTLDANINFIVNHPIEVLTNFLNTLGNLIIGGFIPIPQNVFAVSIPTFIGIASGYLFLFQTVFLLIYFFQKKYESTKILLLFSIWMAAFFLPNWLIADNAMIGSEGRVLGATHRYLTLSAVGLVCFLGYVISKLKNNYLQGFLLLIIVLSNIFVSNQILEKESAYRSTKVTKPIWDKIEKDVPAGEENMIFFISGEDKFRVNDISQAKIPFALKRGIKSFDKWPRSTSDPGVVKRYLCGNNEERKIVPLSHLHAWYIKGTTIDNISEKVRKEFSKVDCSFE